MLRSLHLLLSACQHESLFNSAHVKLSQSNSAWIMCMKEQHSQSTKIQSTLLHAALLVIHFLSSAFHHSVLLLSSSCPRPVLGALPPMLHGAPAVVGPAGGLAGTARVAPPQSNARSGSLGSDGHSSLGRVAPAQKRGKAEEKEAVG